INDLPYETNTIVENLCPGDSVLIYGIWYGPGMYMDTVVGIGPECDTVVTIQINELPYETNTINEDVCPGDVVVIYGITYGPGTYLDTITGVGPECDTIVTIIVTDLGYETNTINEDVCPGDVVVIYGVTYGPGTYLDTITGVGAENGVVETMRVDEPAYENNTNNEDASPADPDVLC